MSSTTTSTTSTYANKYAGLIGTQYQDSTDDLNAIESDIQTYDYKIRLLEDTLDAQSVTSMMMYALFIWCGIALLLYFWIYVSANKPVMAWSLMILVTVVIGGYLLMKYLSYYKVTTLNQVGFYGDKDAEANYRILVKSLEKQRAAALAAGGDVYNPDGSLTAYGVAQLRDDVDTSLKTALPGTTTVTKPTMNLGLATTDTGAPLRRIDPVPVTQSVNQQWTGSFITKVGTEVRNSTM